MSTDLQVCEEHALRLSSKERAILAERLITSLDSLEESEIESLWVEEAESRYMGYHAGIITARPAADVLNDARTKMK